MRSAAWVALVLCVSAAAPGWSAEPAPLVPTLAPWQVLSGKGEVTSVEGTMTARLTEGWEFLVASAPFPVQPDTIYRVKLRLKCQPDLRVYARVEEVKGAQPGALHGLAPWPGYALPPPAYMDLYTYYASSPGAQSARVNLVMWPGQGRKTGEASLQTLALTEVAKVDYPPTDSASFLLNGDCEAADDKGVALYWQSWGGAAENRRVAPGAGRNGSSALAVKGNYYLSAPNFLPHPLRRYRLGAWFKGTGTVSFELRGFHSWEISAMGQSSGRFTASPDEWRWFSMETVALPGQTQISPMMAISEAEDATMLLDDASLVEVGRQK